MSDAPRLADAHASEALTPELAPEASATEIALLVPRLAGRTVVEAARLAGSAVALTAIAAALPLAASGRAMSATGRGLRRSTEALAAASNAMVETGARLTAWSRTPIGRPAVDVVDATEVPRLEVEVLTEAAPAVDHTETAPLVVEAPAPLAVEAPASLVVEAPASLVVEAPASLVIEAPALPVAVTPPVALTAATVTEKIGTPARTTAAGKVTKQPTKKATKKAAKKGVAQPAPQATLSAPVVEAFPAAPIPYYQPASIRATAPGAAPSVTPAPADEAPAPAPTPASPPAAGFRRTTGSRLLRPEE